MSKPIGCVTYSVTKCRKCGEVRVTGDVCNSCRKEYFRNYQLLNKESVKQQRLEYYKKNKESIIAYQKQYVIDNRDKVVAKRKVTTLANKETRREYKKVYYAKNAEILKAKAKAWQDANKDRARLRAKAYGKSHAEERAEYNKRYRKANHQKILVDVKNRKLKKLLVGGKLSSDIRIRLYDIQGGLCPCCGEILGENFHLDHIVPISLGGLNDDSNVQLLRDKCNLEKSDTPASIWAERKELEMFFENGLTRFRNLKEK